AFADGLCKRVCRHVDGCTWPHRGNRADGTIAGGGGGRGRGDDTSRRRQFQCDVGEGGGGGVGPRRDDGDGFARRRGRGCVEGRRGEARCAEVDHFEATQLLAVGAGRPLGV